MKLIRLVPLILAGATASPLTAQAPAATPPITAPTFAADVAPIVFANCTPCHRPGEATPFSLTNYEEVRRRARLIADVTHDRFMPPWHADSDVAAFRDDRRLTDAQIHTLSAWAAAGAPRGNAAQAPGAPKFTTGWQLGEPDLVVRMSEAMRIPEDGPDLFRNFALALNLPEDRWVAAIEFRPSGKASHHALFFYDTTGNSLRQDQSDPAPGFGGMGFLGGQGARRAGDRDMLRALLGGGSNGPAPIGVLGGWAVGGTPAELPEGAARLLPKGAALVLQMHFHPSGKPETEQAVIGVHFAAAAPTRTLVELQMPPLFGAVAGIDLMPGEPRTVIRDSFTLPVDMDVLGGGGHAHYLASDMHMTITPPGGATHELLTIPNWDFNWQERNYFEKPVRLVAGTRIDVEIAYDNSAANPANPFDTPRRVRFGLESTDEMGSIGLDMLPVREADVPVYAAAVREHLRKAFIDRISAGRPGTAATN